jgi:hypothetical protein
MTTSSITSTISNNTTHNKELNKELNNIYLNLYERRKTLTERIIDLHKASNVVHVLKPIDLLNAYTSLNNDENIEYANNVITSWYQYHAYLELGIVNTQLYNVATILQKEC